MKTFLMTAMAALIATSSIFAQTQPAQNTPEANPKQAGQSVPDPTKFAAAAAAGNEFEIQTAKIALRKSSETGIRSFARQLLTDHEKASAELAQAAKSQGVSADPVLSAEQTEQVKALEAAPDDQFGATFLSLQAVAHQKALELHALYGDDGEQGALKAHARAQLSTLRTHLVHAQSAARQ